MNKIVLIMLVLAIGFAGCSGNTDQTEWEIRISGHLKTIGNGEITLQAWADTTNTVIPVELNQDDKSFSKILTIKQPGYYRLTLFGETIADLILFKNDINIELDDMNRVAITGSPEMDLIRSIDSLRNSFDEMPEMVQLNDEFSVAVESNNEAIIERLRERYRTLLDKFNDDIAETLIKASPSIGVIQLLSGNIIDRERHFNVYEKVAASFTGEWEKYDLVKEFKDKVTLLKKTAIGSTAPEIHLPDPTGQFMKLSDFRGKYVLVDFWAKWCGPCRRENPNLVKAYNRFKGSDFEVIGVSLDRNKEDWVQAIAEDGLSWVHLSDLKYFESVAARDYNITAIPYSVLIDPNGVIVAKNLRGQELHKTLEKFLKKSS